MLRKVKTNSKLTRCIKLQANLYKSYITLGNYSCDLDREKPQNCYTDSFFYTSIVFVGRNATFGNSKTCCFTVQIAKMANTSIISTQSAGYNCEKNYPKAKPETQTFAISVERKTFVSLLQRRSILCRISRYGRQNPDKKALLNSIDQSLSYLQTRSAEITYRRYENSTITRTRILKSLQRFRQILLASNSIYELNTTVAQEFNFYQSLGKDGKGSVLFTAYYEPLYAASRVPTAQYRYPIYRLPPDLNRWPRPHPERRELEGIDGLQGAKGKLRGLELFWFRDRLEPYMIQIQGSGRLRFLDGSQTTVGYAGNVAHNYKSIGRELANDGIFPVESITMPVILDYFQKNPEKLDVYIPKGSQLCLFPRKFWCSCSRFNSSTFNCRTFDCY